MNDPIKDAVENEVQATVSEVIENVAEETAHEVTQEILERVADEIRESFSIENEIKEIRTHLSQIQDTLNKLNYNVDDIKNVSNTTLALELNEAIEQESENELTEDITEEPPVEVAPITDIVTPEVFETVKADEPSAKRGTKVRMI